MSIRLTSILVASFALLEAGCSGSSGSAPPIQVRGAAEQIAEPRLGLSTDTTLPEASVFGRNLVVNGGAESGPGAPNSSAIDKPPGWTLTGTMTAVQYGASGGFPDKTSPGPSDRGKNFFAGGPSAAVSTATQSISVSSGAAQIDRGLAKFTLTAYLGGFDGQADSAKVTVTFLSNTGKSLGSVVDGPVTEAERKGVTGLLKAQKVGKVPEGTRSLSVKLTCTRESGEYNDGYADSIELTLAT